jgi:DNA mismatch endonuclease (patch repair protein)
MADRWSKAKRSQVMSRIRSRGNKGTELRLIEILRAHRITGWRRRQRLLGNPDFVFRRKHVAVFVDGCFWHGCPRCYRRPGSNQTYWDDKFIRNRRRDRQVSRKLAAAGWTVIRLWEHSLSADRKVAEKIRGKLLSRRRSK